VRLAARGRRETEAGDEAITDPWLADRLRERAREVYVQAALAAGVLTALALLLPGGDGA
jgi:hypothetical protein